MKYVSGRTLWKIIAVIVVLGLIIGAYFMGKAKPAGEEEAKEENKETVATVKIAQAAEGEVEKDVVAYGSVAAIPEDVVFVSAPFESRAKRIMVITGQTVKADMPVIDIEPTPDAELSLADARVAAAAAQRDFTQVQQRLELRLATKTELSAAQQTLQTAQSKLKSLEARQIRPHKLLAQADGLVTKVDVDEGQVSAAGSPLVEIVPADRVQVRLGIEPRGCPS